MITGNQIRLARFGLRLSVQELSDRTGISIRTLKRIEASDEVPNSNARTIQSLKVTLEAAGIEFIGTPDDGPGIRIHVKPKSEAD